MTSAEAFLGLRTDEQYSPVGLQEAFLGKVLDDWLSRWTEGAESVPPLLPEVLADPMFLQA